MTKLSKAQKRKIVVSTFVSLDGVMQAPGGPEEDVEGKFKQGGWSVNFWDEMMGNVMGESMGEGFDILVGRKTYEIFASHWPHTTEPGSEGMNNANKYVVSKSLSEVTWQNSHLISKNIPKEINKVKNTEGPVILVMGSSELIPYLLKHKLVDEISLWIFPVALGKGKKVFGENIIPVEFELKDIKQSTTGVIIATYAVKGEFQATGSFALEDPTPQEIERRKKNSK